jgi:hypothetical protein
VSGRVPLTELRWRRCPDGDALSETFCATAITDGPQQPSNAIAISIAARARFRLISVGESKNVP